MTLKKQITKSAKWIFLYSGCQRVISFCTSVILARLLEPEIFGMYALAFVVIDGFGLFKSMGFDSAVIQRKTDVDKAANTAFIIIPALGVFLYLLLVLAAPYISSFLEQNEMISVLKALGLIFVLGAINRVPQVLLEKNLQFKILAICGIVIEIVFSICAIALSLFGMGIWSLVISFLIKNLISVILIFYYSGWRPKFEFDIAIAKDMFHFGKYIFFGSIIWFVVNTFDKIVIPKILDLTTLGYYTIALNLATFASTYLTGKLTDIIYPAYCKLQGNLYDLKMAYLQSTRILTLIILPICAGLYLIGGDFLELTYGQKWLGSIPILKFFAWIGFFRSIGGNNNSIFLSLKNSKISFKYDVFRAVATVGLVIPAANLYGVTGIAGVILSISFITFIFSCGELMRLIKINLPEYLANLKSAILGTICMTSVIIFIKLVLLQNDITLWLRFGLPFLFGSIAYGVIVLISEKKLVKEMIGLVFK
ncbi:MAG: lipopolysaccharide biosynthesis protein [Candidatus Omnitrophota bacterium]